MIYVKNTPNNTGVAIYGDYLDFQNLYDALHAITGDEEEFVRAGPKQKCILEDKCVMARDAFCHHGTE